MDHATFEHPQNNGNNPYRMVFVALEFAYNNLDIVALNEFGYLGEGQLKEVYFMHSSGARVFF